MTRRKLGAHEWIFPSISENVYFIEIQKLSFSKISDMQLWSIFNNQAHNYLKKIE